MKPEFATAINCIDGRVQAPVNEFIRHNYGVDYVDVITVPAPDRVLSENGSVDIIRSIKEYASISVEKHGSNIIVIAGHHDCAANPVGEKEHRRQIGEAVKNIKEWGLGVDVHGVWVGEDWEAVLL